jgi:arylformamidase
LYPEEHIHPDWRLNLSTTQRLNFPVIYDITPSITPKLAVWPGDTPASREVLCDIARDDNITLSTLRATVHLGAHADGPNHYGKDAQSIDERSLDYYLGPCQVIRVKVARATRILPSMVRAELTTPRVLFATETYPDPQDWNSDFAALSVELIDLLHDRGVITVGIDTPSVDLFESKDLPAHKAILRHNMAILEGLVLKDVPEGMYELIALPLSLAGFDASPVRAILRSM